MCKTRDFRYELPRLQKCFELKVENSPITWKLALTSFLWYIIGYKQNARTAISSFPEPYGERLSAMTIIGVITQQQFCGSSLEKQEVTWYEEKTLHNRCCFQWNENCPWLLPINIWSSGRICTHQMETKLTQWKII